MPASRLAALLVVVPALLASACGGEPPTIPQREPPVSPPAATWDLSKVPDAGPVLAAWDAKEGVRVLVLARGEGPETGETTVMDVAYTGYLRTGQEFERSVMRFGGRYDRSSLIAGMRIGLEGIRHGERRRILIPAAKAYGWETPTPAIPRGSDLVFDVRAFVYQQIDVEVGAGAEAKRGQAVRAHLVGGFPDGRVFLDTRKEDRGEAAVLELVPGRVVDGLVRGVPGMRVGGRRRLLVPASLAYGPAGLARLRIPPHADLVYTVELVEVLGDAPRDARPPR